MSATHTSERIRKLLGQGLAVESIARKIGRPGAEGEARVREEIARNEQPREPLRVLIAELRGED